MPVWGEGWTALDLCVRYRSSYTEHCANNDIHPYQPLYLYKVLLKSVKIYTHSDPQDTRYFLAGAVAQSQKPGCFPNSHNSKIEKKQIRPQTSQE